MARIVLVGVIVALAAEVAAAPSPSTAPFAWLIAPPVRPQLERVAVVGGDIVGIDAGKLVRLDGDKWVPGKVQPPLASVQVVTVAAGAAVRTSDGQRFALPPSTKPQIAALGAAAEPIVVMVDGRVWRWSTERQTVDHTDGRDGRRAYFVTPLPPGFELVRGDVPPDIIGVVISNGSAVLVGREGDVARLDADTAVTFVKVPRPRSLALVPVDDHVVAITADGVTVARGGATTAVALDAETLADLREVERKSEELGVGRLVASRSGADAAVFGAGRDVVEVAGDRATRWRLPGTEEVLAVARDAHHGFVVLGHHGQVFARGTSGLVALGSLSAIKGPAVPHPIGAFTGADGRARLVDFDRTLVCAAPMGLTACGSTIAIRSALAHAIDGALVIEDQSIKMQLVGDASTRQLPNAVASARRRVFAGTSIAPLALADNTLVRFDGTAWQTLAQVPAPWIAQSLAADGKTIYIGVRGGAVLTFPMPP